MANQSDKILDSSENQAFYPPIAPPQQLWAAPQRPAEPPQRHFRPPQHLCAADFQHCAPSQRVEIAIYEEIAPKRSLCAPTGAQRSSLRRSNASGDGAFEQMKPRFEGGMRPDQPVGRKRIAQRFIAGSRWRSTAESRRDDRSPVLRHPEPKGVLSSLRDFRGGGSEPSDESLGYWRPSLRGLSPRTPGGSGPFNHAVWLRQSFPADFVGRGLHHQAANEWCVDAESCAIRKFVTLYPAKET